MQLANEPALASTVAGLAPNETPVAREIRYAQYKVIRRNGAVVGFEPSKISIAMTKAFIAVNGGQGAASARVREQVATLTENVVVALMRRQPSGGTFHIEDIQDQVELALMRAGEHNVARAYVLYREERSQERARRQRESAGQAARAQPAINVKEGGQVKPLDLVAHDRRWCATRARGSGAKSARSRSCRRCSATSTTACRWRKCASRLILAARALIEQDPGYSYVTARLLLHTLRLETLGEEVTQAEMNARYAEYLPEFIKQGIEAELLDERLAQLRPEVPGRGARRQPRPQVHLSRAADSLRPLFPARARPPHRAAADFLHARGDGAWR